MNKHFIELQDGIRVEVEADQDRLQRVSGGGATRVNKSIDDIKPLLKKACKPIIEVWQELNQDLAITEAEVEVCLGFEAEGNAFIAKGKTNASLTLRLTLKPKS